MGYKVRELVEGKGKARCGRETGTFLRYFEGLRGTVIEFG